MITSDTLTTITKEILIGYEHASENLSKWW